MSTKISAYPGITPPLATDDLFVVVDTSGAVTDSVRADQNLLYTKVSLTTGQILALNTTPIDLVAAPGAGKVTIIDFIVLSLTFNSIVYATNTVLQLVYDTGVAYTFDSNTTLLASADAIFTRHVGDDVEPAAGYLQNKKVSITVGTGDPTAGDSAMDVYTFYQILTL